MNKKLMANSYNKCADQESEISLRKESSFSDSASDKVNVLNSSGLGEDISAPILDPLTIEQKVLPLEIQHSHWTTQMAAEAEFHNEIVVDEGKCSDEGSNVSATHDTRATAAHLSSHDANTIDCLSKDLGQHLRLARNVPIRRKLLVLDVNGLLADIVMPAPKGHRCDIHILGRAIFKRPFYDDFLKFCFENFDVGIWSSRSKKIFDRVVDYLLGNLKEKLSFCWDMSHSTETGFKTLENIHKPLVCKELKKIWENDDPILPWKKGDYDESNTLLLDDSPYKALLNPPHTSIFPNSYRYLDKDDNSLGPGGDLRVYLEGLLVSENVQNYVEHNPFGQSAINETSSSWEFYSGVLQAVLNQQQEN